MINIYIVMYRIFRERGFLKMAQGEEQRQLVESILTSNPKPILNISDLAKKYTINLKKNK